LLLQNQASSMNIRIAIADNDFSAQQSYLPLACRYTKLGALIQGCVETMATLRSNAILSAL
jgi:hypothetical protein